MAGHAPFGGNGALRGGNEGLWEKLHLFRIFGFPDGTYNVTVSPSEITARPGRVWQKTAGRCSGSLCCSLTHTESRIDKLAYVNFHVAAQHLVQSCKSNCHVLKAMYFKCFVAELSCFKSDTYEMLK